MDRAAFAAALDAASALMDRPRLDRLAHAQRVVVYSYGARGAHLAAQLREAGVKTLVFDNAAPSRLRAAADGFEVVMRLPDAIPVIVASGQHTAEILVDLAGRPDVHALQEALWAFDLVNSYGPARAFTAVVGERRDELHAVFGALDADSRVAFLDVLRFRASLDVRQCPSRRPLRESWLPPMPMTIAAFCDVGAYDGDTLAALKDAYPGLARTFTVEPNPDLQAPIAAAAARLGLNNSAYQGAAWRGPARLEATTLANRMMVIREAADGLYAADALDGLTAGETFDYVKFDVEGAEGPAIEGAAQTLRRARCVGVAAYHYPADIIDLPKLLQAILGSGWSLAFRHYAQSFEDSVVYAYR
jgi:FkbM family methyltransferase